MLKVTLQNIQERQGGVAALDNCDKNRLGGNGIWAILELLMPAAYAFDDMKVAVVYIDGDELCIALFPVSECQATRS